MNKTVEAREAPSIKNLQKLEQKTSEGVKVRAPRAGPTGRWEVGRRTKMKVTGDRGGEKAAGRQAWK